MSHSFLAGMTSENAPKERARDVAYILYPDSMVPDWKERLDALDLPYAYCIHDKDMLGKCDDILDSDQIERKVHVHLLLHWDGPTTLLNAFKLINKSLTAEGHKRCSLPAAKVERVRPKFEYLIHRTKKAIEAGKFQYPVEERITGNNYDIGSYEQVSEVEKDRLLNNMIDTICQYKLKSMVEVRAYYMARSLGDADHPDRTEWDIYNGIAKGFHSYLQKYFGPFYDAYKAKQKNNTLGEG